MSYSRVNYDDNAIMGVESEGYPSPAVKMLGGTSSIFASASYLFFNNFRHFYNITHSK